MEKRTNITCCASIGIFAWNEEAGICATLESLLKQSVFTKLLQRGSRVELIVLVNGTTDKTVKVAEQFFKEKLAAYPGWQAVLPRVVDIPERGKLNAWNRYVHDISSRSSQFLFMMDADIDIHLRDTLFHLLHALESDDQAYVATDVPRKDLAFKSRRSLSDQLSLNQAKVTTSSSAQLCGQLYCIRAGVARNIWMPQDLPACEDGFLKAVVCTDFLTKPVNSKRIVVPAQAEHTFEAYTSPMALLKNQKRQVIGQTFVHLLVDKFLPNLSEPERLQLGITLQTLDQQDPGWLKRLLSEHIGRHRAFWKLYPGLATERLKRLKCLSGGALLACLPATALGTGLTLAASWMARSSLRRGATDYWPRAQRSGLTGPTSSSQLSLAAAPVRKN